MLCPGLDFPQSVLSIANSLYFLIVPPFENSLILMWPAHMALIIAFADGISSILEYYPDLTKS